MKKTILTILLLTLSAFLITACEQEQYDADKLLILTSSFPLYEFAREIAPEEDVRMIVPPGVDIHHYDLKPSDLVLLERADLIIFIGEEMEPWLDNILNQRNYETLQATKHTNLIKAKHGHSQDDERDDERDNNYNNDNYDSELEQLIKEIDYIIHEWEDGDLTADEALEEIEDLIHDFPNKNALIERIDYLIHEWEDGDLTADEAMEQIEDAIHNYNPELEQLIKEIDYIIHEWEDGDLSAEEALEEIEDLIHDFPNKNALIERIDYLIHEWEDGDLSADEAMEQIEDAIHDYENHDEDNEHDDERDDVHRHDSEYDPHVWLDFENSIEIVNAITSRLSTIKPENAQEYRTNADEYIKELRKLDKKYAEELANCETRYFITSHDAFGYLANKYDLKQIPIRGLSAEQEPSPRTMTTIIKEAREHNIRHVFFEELASPRISQALANEIGAETLMITPAENIPAKDFGQKTFIEVMNQNLENLKQGLRCN
jgi:ABC-type Zn uptake system ZnuABC Zn-binding protein ZnuA